MSSILCVRACGLSASLGGSGLSLRQRVAEPIIEADRAEARISTGGEGLIVQLRAEVAGVVVCDHLAWVLGLPQLAAGEFGERYPFRTGNLHHAVQGRAEGHVGHCVSHVVGAYGLQNRG